MKKIFASMMLAAGVLSAQNLIRDPDFDKGNFAELQFDAYPGTMKNRIETEDLTWNKCLSIEIVKHHIVPKTGKKECSISCWIGKEGKGPGFPVEPNTVYEFQFECKGNIVPSIRYSEWDGMDFWKNKKEKNAVITSKPIVSRNWNIVKGTFTTSATAKRAALLVYRYGSEQWKNLPPVGSKFMIDKVRVQKRKSLLSAGGAVPVVEKKSTRPCILPGKTYSGFSLINSGKKAQVQTAYSITMRDGKMIVDVLCTEPKMSKLAAKVTEDGGKVWNDDCVEIFFGSGDPKRNQNQFVVAAGGGRWMGHGENQSLKEFDKWTAAVRKEKGAWTVHGEFPLSLLGWEKLPGPGETIPFLVARNRVNGRESSSSAQVKDTFNNKKYWGIFFPYGLKTWFDNARKELLKQASENQKLSSEISKWTSSGIPEKDLAKAEFFRESMSAAKLTGRKFVLTLNSVVTDTEIPYLPATLAEPPEKISYRAAGNDFCWVPLAVTNLTNRMEEYRIVVTAIEPRTKREKYALETADGKIYPADKMTLFRGIRVKDGDEESHGFRYDPLVPMDIAQTVTVAFRESAPVWIRFNTKNVVPGVYKGVVRVIPLGESQFNPKRNQPDVGSSNIKYSYRDVPFSFEVLPFTLSEETPTRKFLFERPYSKDGFRQMREAQVDTFLINTWGAKFTFDKEGNITEKDTSSMEKSIQCYLEFARDSGMEEKMRYCFCYAAYRHFMQILTKGTLKPFTPAWERGWLAYMKEVDLIRQKYNIPLDRWTIEINDEPKLKDLPALTRAAELAVKENPDLRFMVTFASWELPPEELKKMVPYIYEWCFWSTKYFTMPGYASLIATIRTARKTLSIYECSTSMRLSLKQYYRRHPWTIPCFNLQGCHMYQYVTYLHRDRDWKESARGEIALFSNQNVVTTIRGECLAAGFSDLRYWRKLEEVREKVKPGSSLDNEIKAFMDSTPRQLVLETPGNIRCFDDAREKMIDLILKVENGKTN